MRLIFRLIAAMVALTVTLALGGCGWHLAGQASLPSALSKVYINYSDPYQVGAPPLQIALQQHLASRGAQILSDPEADAATIRLYNLQNLRNVIAIGQDGTAVEYQLVTTVSYQVFKNGKALTSPTTQSFSSDYSFNAQHILAKEAEAQRLRDYIQQQLADLILLRINALLSHPQPVIGTAPAGAGSVAAPATSTGGSPASAASVH